jgi:predicted nuclease of predicted toxin-antitoxin system
MRILANENIPGPVVSALRDRGHDVLSVKEAMRGATDRAVLARAQADKRVLVTCDKDFGELAVRIGLPAGCGVVLLRPSGPNPDTDNARAVAALTSRDDWVGHFAVVTDDRIRLRVLTRSK